MKWRLEYPLLLKCINEQVIIPKMPVKQSRVRDGVLQELPSFTPPGAQHREREKEGSSHPTGQILMSLTPHHPLQPSSENVRAAEGTGFFSSLPTLVAWLVVHQRNMGTQALQLCSCSDKFVWGCSHCPKGELKLLCSWPHSASVLHRTQELVKRGLSHSTGARAEAGVSSEEVPRCHHGDTRGIGEADTALAPPGGTRASRTGGPFIFCVFSWNGALSSTIRGCLSTQGIT